MVEAGGQGGGLPEVAAQLHHHDAAVHGGNLLQQRERVVAASIVYKDQFERLARGLHDHLQAVVELGDVLFLVVKRYDD